MFSIRCGVIQAALTTEPIVAARKPSEYGANIYKMNGKFVARMMINNIKHEQSFTTIEDAVLFRDTTLSTHKSDKELKHKNAEILRNEDILKPRHRCLGGIA